MPEYKRGSRNTTHMLFLDPKIAVPLQRQSRTNNVMAFRRTSEYLSEECTFRREHQSDFLGMNYINE